MNLAASAADHAVLNLKRSVIQGARPKLRRLLQLSPQLAQTSHQLSGQLLCKKNAQLICPGQLLCGKAAQLSYPRQLICGKAAQLSCTGQLLGSCGRAQLIVVVVSDSGTGCESYESCCYICTCQRSRQERL